jgi:hypothetical protein
MEMDIYGDSEINEVEVNWNKQNAPRQYLAKKDVFAIGEITAKLLRTIEKTKKSGAGNLYKVYDLELQLDEFTIKWATDVFDRQMDWFGKKVIPDKILISVGSRPSIVKGEEKTFYNWKMKALTTQTKLI